MSLEKIPSVLGMMLRSGKSKKGTTSRVQSSTPVEIATPMSSLDNVMENQGSQDQVASDVEGAASGRTDKRVRFEPVVRQPGFGSIENPPLLWDDLNVSGNLRIHDEVVSETEDNASTVMSTKKSICFLYIQNL